MGLLCERICSNGVLLWAVVWLKLLVYSQTVNAASEFGCLPVDRGSPKFLTSAGNYNPVSVKHENCIRACGLLAGDIKHAGLQSGQCLCTDTTYSLTETVSDCGQPCSGDTNQACGNDTHIAVLSGPRSWVDVHLTKPVQPVLSGQEFSLAVTESLGDDVLMAFGAGDGSLTTGFSSSGMTSHVYLTSGEYVAVVMTQTNAAINGLNALPISVAMAISDVCLRCPVAVEIIEPFECTFECTVEVSRGSHVNLTLSMGDEVQPMQILGSPQFTMLGVIGKYGSEVQDPASTWLLPGTESLQSTSLLAVEALITLVGDGSFTLMVLKPVCTEADQEYCATDNICKSDYVPSSNGNPIRQDTCSSASQFYCLAESVCTTTSQAQSRLDPRPDRFSDDPQRPSYEIVKSVPMTVASLGVFQYDFTDHVCDLFPVGVGYILGFSVVEGGARIGTEVESGANNVSEYKSTASLGSLDVGATLQLSSFELTMTRHLIRAVVVSPLISQSQFSIQDIGDYEISASVVNTVNPFGVMNSTNVSAVLPIKGLMHNDFKNSSSPNSEITATIWVQNGSHIHYDIDWGDGSQNVVDALDKTPFNESHSYTATGIYELNITASNPFSNETVLITINIQNPVIRSHYDITTNSPQAVDGHGTPGPVVFTIQLTNPSGEAVATSPGATFTCLEGVTFPSADSTDLSSLTVDEQSKTHSLNFFEQGVYTINITIANLVSEESYIVEVEMIELLTEVVSRTKYKPSSSASSTSIPGYGTNKSTFPLDRPVIFTMSYSTGSNVNYIVDFKDGSELGNYTHDVKGESFSFEHLFPRIGTFNVVVTSSNPVTPSQDLRFTIETLRPIRGIHILDTKVTRINETRNLTLTMENIGTASCLIVDFNDNSPTVAYGACDPHNNILGNLSSEILLSHVYTEQGSFDVKAYGWNTLSWENSSILIPVMEAEKHCGLPKNSIQDPSPGWWLPKVRTRKDRLSFQGITKLDCWFTQNSKLWTLHRVDPQTGTIGENFTSKLEQQSDTVTLVIKEFALDINLYRIGFKVTMDKSLTDNIEISAIAYDYFDIQRSKLIVALMDSELTSLVKGLGTSLDLIPGKVSRDPDLSPEEEQVFDNITYLCRRKGEQWPSTLVLIAIPLDRNESSDNSNNTGCFGTGPGILDHFGDTLSWNTSLMDVDVVFEIMVIILKDVRRGNFSLSLEIKVGDPPQAGIRIGDGTIFAPGDGVQIINPTGSVRLSASCLEFCDGVVYTWDAHGVNSAGNEEDLPGWETLTSGNKEHLYVQKELFQLGPRYSVYQFRANLYNIQGGHGYAGLKIRLNQPPAGGSCMILSYNLTLGDVVTVTCEGWRDYEGIVSYKFFAQATNLRGEVILLTSAKGVVDLLPPLGPVSDGYRVSLGVTVEDLIGASTKVIFANVTVTPSKTERSENFTAEQEALYQTLKDEGNPEVINSQLILDASLLFAAPQTSPPQDAVDSSEDSPTQSEEELQKAEEERAAAKTEEVTRMAELVSAVEYTSPEDVISTASTLSIITQDSKALSPKTLDILTGAADSMLSIIENDATAPADENKLNQVGSGLVSFVGNMFAGTEQSVSVKRTSAGSNSAPTSSHGRDTSPVEEKEDKAKEQAKNTLQKLEQIIQGIFAVVVADKLPGEQVTRFSSPNLELLVDRKSAALIANRTATDSVGSVMLEDWCQLTGQDVNCSTEETVDMKLQSTPTNAYRIYPGGNTESFKDGGLVNLTFFNNNSQEIQIHNLSEDSLIDINFRQVEASVDEEFTLVDVTGANSTLNHKFILEGAAETVFIQFRPENKSAVYALLVSSLKAPTLLEYDFLFLLPNVSETESTSPSAPDTEDVTKLDNPIHTSASSTLSNSTANSTDGWTTGSYSTMGSTTEFTDMSTSRATTISPEESTTNSTEGWTTGSYSTMGSTTEFTDMSTSRATTISPGESNKKTKKPKHNHGHGFTSVSTSTEGLNTSTWSAAPDNSSSPSDSNLTYASTTDNPLTSNQSTSVVTSDPDGGNSKSTTVVTDSMDELTTLTWSTTPDDSKSPSNTSTGDNPTTSNRSTSSAVTSDWVGGNSNSVGVDTDSADQRDDEVVTHTVSFGQDYHKGKTGSYIFRLAEISPDGALEENFTMNYSLRVIQAQCSYFDIKTNKWYTDGVRMVMNNKTNLPICQTSHLTPFTSSWIVKPVPLDFENLFNDASILTNPTIYATCTVVYTFFFFVFVWARRKDKKDILQLGVTPLPDNNPSHSYLYEMVVITGKRMNAGTDSKVSFVLSGDDDETDTKSLEDTKRKTLQRGSIDRFLLATAKPLGTLNYMRVWHDNSGKGNAQSWYLSYIAIRDLQTKQRYFFICNDWFSVVDGDGQVDRLLPVAGKEQVQEFGHVFSSQTGKNFNDSHLWVSILTRPPGSRFTRMQRTMCCMMAMWLEMLTSIMFYGVADKGPSTKPINLGAFSLSPKEIAIGIQSNLIIFPATLLMVQLFRKSRVRRKRRSRIEVAREEQVTKMGKNSVHPIKTKEEKNCDTVSSRDIFIINSENDTSIVDIEDTKPLCKSKPKRRQRWSFPWWSVYIAWILSIVITLLATMFTFFYGLQYKNHKTASWLRSIVISFFFGVMLTQPVKVVLVSLFVALVFKSPNSDEDADLEEDEEDCELKQDEEWLHSFFGTSDVHPAAKQPPDPQTTEKIRIQRIKELKMYSIIREIIFLIIFIWILSVFSYGNHDPYSFWTKDAYVKLLVNGDRNHTLMKAVSIPKFWQWVETGLVPGLIAGKWYNNDDPGIDQHLFIGDRCSKILGKVYFRQLRVPRGACEIQSEMKDILSECNIGYSMGQEDKAPYGVGWTAYNPNVTQRPEYNYTDATTLDSYPIWGRHTLYLGGGYIFNVDTSSMEGVKASMRKMYEEAWIDRYTRALFIEISVYNAQTNLFSYINLIEEILPTGGCYPWYRIEILRLLQYNEGMGLVRLICEVSYFVFIAFMLVKEILLVRKEGKAYLKEVWNWNEMFIIGFSLTLMVLYFYRIYVTSAFLEAFEKNDKNMNLQYVAYWNLLLGYMLGLVVFLSNIKLLKLLRFNRRMGILSSTIRSCSKELMNFLFMFFFVFTAFAAVFYLIFCNHLYNYSDILFTMETMITAVLGKFRFGEMLTVSVLGPFFFFCFTGYVCFVMINVFLTIIIGAFKTVKGDIEKQSNEYEMVDFILNHFKSWTGMGGKKDEEDLPNLDMEEYKADITNSLPDKVDQMLNRIARVYFDQGTLNTFAKEMTVLEEKVEKKQKKRCNRKIFTA